MLVVRFTALWCTSCLIMKSRWDMLFLEHPEFEVIDFDYDEEQDMVKKYFVGQTLPVMIVFDNEEEVLRVIGEKSKKELFHIFEGLRI